MKLTKKKLLDSVGLDIVGLGYKKFEDGFFGSDGLFIKTISDGFFLTLGLTISRHYDSKFTASFYLSKSTRWGSVWGDIPKESYKRIGFFMTDDEKKTLFDEEYQFENIKDAWWDAFDTNSIHRFLSVVKLSEPRFIDQPGLIWKVKNSIEVNMLAEYASTVDQLVSTIKDASHEFKYIPLKPIKNIPIEWFKSAEIALIKNGGILNVNTVKLLTADAWVINKVKNT